MKSKHTKRNTNKKRHKFIVSVSEYESNFIHNYAKLSGFDNPDELVSRIFRTTLFEIATTKSSKSTPYKGVT